MSTARTFECVSRSRAAADGAMGDHCRDIRGAIRATEAVEGFERISRLAQKFGPSVETAVV